MRTRDIEIFYWIAQLGSFHAAAKRLNTTQPNISARIRALEVLFGAQLFERNKKGRTTLSPQGHLLLPYAERMLRLSEEMLNKVADKVGHGGVLRLGAAESVAHTWLVNLLDVIRGTYRNLAVEVTVDTSPRLLSGLKNNDL